MTLEENTRKFNYTDKFWQSFTYLICVCFVYYSLWLLNVLFYNKYKSKLKKGNKITS